MKRFEVMWFEYVDSSKVVSNKPLQGKYRILKNKGFTDREKFERHLMRLHKKGAEIVGIVVDFHKVPENELANW